MQIVYTGEKFPESYTSSIFLVGPTPRSEDVHSWRPEALKALERSGYDGVVFVPEPRDGKWSLDYTGQVDWEEEGLNLADCILAWVPRNLETMPAFTTNVEFGIWMDSGKMVFGAPSDAPKNTYLLHYANRLGIPVSTTLEDTVKSALAMVGTGAPRSGGERYIPLHIWRLPHFQNWYKALLEAGNRLDKARVVWTFRVGQKGNFVFLFALHVDVYITSENRHKTNEVVISRPDIATVLLYRRAEDIMNTEIVLVREFRVPVSNQSGFVLEIPGGSSFKPTTDPLVLMAEECHEEVGLVVDPTRVRTHETREIIPTLSAHKAHLFSVELTEKEIIKLRAMEKEGTAHGVEEDTERTYVHIRTLSEILNQALVSWSMLGMILSVLIRK